MLKKVKQGDPIRAEDFNALVDEINRLKSESGYIEKTVKGAFRNIPIGPFLIFSEGGYIKVKNYNETLTFSEKLPYQIIQAHNGRLFWYDINQLGVDTFSKKRRSLKEWSYDFVYSSAWNGLPYRYLLQSSASGDIAHLRYRENILPVSVFSLNPDQKTITVAKSVESKVIWKTFSRTLTEGDIMYYSEGVSYYILYYANGFRLEESIPDQPETPCYVLGNFRHDGEDGFTFFSLPAEIIWAMIYSMYMTAGFSGMAAFPDGTRTHYLYFQNGICYGYYVT